MVFDLSMEFFLCGSYGKILLTMFTNVFIIYTEMNFKFHGGFSNEKKYFE